jgi:hypothetical protein
VRRYALLRRHKDGRISAMIDSAYCMKWSYDKAYLWRSPPVHYKDNTSFIVRVGSKNCPIKVTKGLKCNNDFIKRST